MDAAAGGLMMDDLSAYLRAAMPHMRDTSSTLAQELELARAYVGILKVQLGKHSVSLSTCPGTSAIRGCRR
jgi:LytS/YehU family sensor histidine kinase